MSRQENLATALERMADALMSHPTSVVGMRVTATNTGEGGSVTGLKVSVAAGPGSRNITGVSATAGQRNPADEALIQELRDAAIAVRSGNPHKSWIMGLIARAKALGNRALDGLVEAAAAAAAAYFLGTG